MANLYDEMTEIETPPLGTIKLQYHEFKGGVSLTGPGFAIVIDFPDECRDRQLELTQVV